MIRQFLSLILMIQRLFINFFRYPLISIFAISVIFFGYTYFVNAQELIDSSIDTGLLLETFIDDSVDVVYEPSPIDTFDLKTKPDSFAEIDSLGNVLRVIVITQDVLNTGHFGDPKNWKQVTGSDTVNVNYAGVGYKYEDSVKEFVSIEKPTKDAVLDERTHNWESLASSSLKSITI